MADKQSSFRTTISVPGDSKARMDRVKESVNWSAVACRAFEDKLAEIAARKERKIMNDVVERLRATMRSQQGNSFNEGYETGREWAENTATAPELIRLEKFQNLTKTTQSEWEDWFCLQDHHKPWLMLLEVIKNEKSVHPSKAIEFWSSMLGETSQKPNDADFLRGFVESAVDLWAKVKEQL